MDYGKILIVNKNTGDVVHYFGEMSGDVKRPSATDLILIELPPNQYIDEFNRLKSGLNSVKVNLQDNSLSFDCIEMMPTPEQRIQVLQDQLLLAQNQLVNGGIF